MPKHVDYYMTLNSPWTYLGGRRLERMLATHGASATIHPVDFGKIFPLSGGLPLPKRAPQRQAYRLMELKRWRDTLGIPINFKPKHWPANDRLARNLVILARDGGLDAIKLAHAIQYGLWAEERDIADAATLEAIATASGFEGIGALLKKADDPAVDAVYDAETEKAAALGVFGAPSYVIDGEIFWGQDRLDFVDRALSR